MNNRAGGRATQLALYGAINAEDEEVWDESTQDEIADTRSKVAHFGSPSVRDSFHDPIDDEDLAESLWSPAVALDPKHRPQIWEAPSSTARRSWCKYPQEAHLLDERNRRYRRLSVDEMAIIQGFEPEWFDVPGLTNRNRIRAIGDAVPPQLARALLSAISTVLDIKDKTAIEICAGSGGLASGALAIPGMRHVALIENWEPACNILRHQKPWPAEAVICGDVREFDFGLFRGRVGLLSGGPPCQPWSLAGQRAGVSDPRDLLGHIHEIVAQLEPEVFLFENVPGLLSETNEPYLQGILDRLSKPMDDSPGYGVVVGMFNAADFGVPQVRRRIFFLGLRDAPASLAFRAFDEAFANATHRDPSAPHATRRRWVTLQEALGNRPDPGGWRKWIAPEELRRAG